MHEDYYGFVEKPFSLTPLTRSISTRAKSHANAFDLLQYAIRRREGFVVNHRGHRHRQDDAVPGDPRAARRRTFTALVLNPFLSEEDLLRLILQDFGVVSRDEIKTRPALGRHQAGADRHAQRLPAGRFLPLRAWALLIIYVAQNLPNSALAAIVIAAALSLMDFPAAATFLRIRRSGFVLMLTATLGVIFFRVLEGILIAVALSILMFFRRNWWPTGEILGRVPRSTRGQRRRVPRRSAGSRGRGFRWRRPFFANAGQFRQEVRTIVRRSDVRWVVVQCEAMTDIDVTAADMLERLDKELNRQGVNMLFVELRTRLHDLVVRYGLLETLDRKHFYASMDNALADDRCPGRLIVPFSPPRREDLDDREAEQSGADTEGRSGECVREPVHLEGRYGSRPSPRSRRRPRSTSRREPDPAR